MEVAAKLRNASISPQKARLVADMIRRKGVEEAINTLSFTQKKAATMIKKVVESAVANAEHNFGADIDDLVISRIFVDQAANYKRIQPRAKGRANRIIKRNSHITVIVSDQEELS